MEFVVKTGSDDRCRVFTPNPLLKTPNQLWHGQPADIGRVPVIIGLEYHAIALGEDLSGLGIYLEEIRAEAMV